MAPRGGDKLPSTACMVGWGMAAQFVRRRVGTEGLGLWAWNDLESCHFRVPTHWKISRTPQKTLSMLKVKLMKWEFRRIRYYPKRLFKLHLELSQKIPLEFHTFFSMYLLNGVFLLYTSITYLNSTSHCRKKKSDMHQEGIKNHLSLHHPEITRCSHILLDFSAYDG